MRKTKCFKLVRKWRVSLQRARAAKEAGNRAGGQTRSVRSHGAPGAAHKSACTRTDQSGGSNCPALNRGRSVSYELLDNARVFSELSHDVLRLIDEVENTSSKLVSSPGMDHQETQRFSNLAGQVLQNAQRGSATCKQINAVITDSVDRIRQGIIVMEQAGMQMLQIIDAVVQGAEVGTFIGNTHQAPSPHSCARADDSESELLQQEASLAVQDLKSWSLVLKRNLQVLRLSGHDDDIAAAWLVGDGTSA